MPDHQGKAVEASEKPVFRNPAEIPIFLALKQKSPGARSGTACCILLLHYVTEETSVAV